MGGVRIELTCRDGCFTDTCSSMEPLARALVSARCVPAPKTKKATWVSRGGLRWNQGVLVLRLPPPWILILAPEEACVGGG